MQTSLLNQAFGIERSSSIRGEIERALGDLR